MNAAPATEPTPLFGGGDQRCQTLCDALLALIEERGGALPLPSVLGVLRIVEHHLIDAVSRRPS